MRFLFGLLTGGTLTWAASLMLGDYLPSPGPAFRWLGAQWEASEKIVDRMQEAPAAATIDDGSRASEQSPASEPEPQRKEPQAPAVAPTPSAEELVEEPAVVIAPEPNGWESAWVPFQTQRSALGFAQVLTRQLNHPFEVRREATHRYRVTFAYADEAERERLLAAVRSLTGSKS